MLIAANVALSCWPQNEMKRPLGFLVFSGDENDWGNQILLPGATYVFLYMCIIGGVSITNMQKTVNITTIETT